MELPPNPTVFCTREAKLLPFLRWNGTELGRQHRSWNMRQESENRKAGGSICYTKHGGSTEGINFLVNLIGISGHFKLFECMLVCAYGHVCAECMYVCVETKAQSNLSLCGMLPTFFFEIRFLIGTEVTRGQLDWLGSGPQDPHVSASLSVRF